MSAGETVADCLKPYIGTNLYYQLLLAEQHGNLEECLQEIGKLMVLQEKQRQKLVNLIQYPLILLGLLIILMIALKVFVFPELSEWGGKSGNFDNFYLIDIFAYSAGGIIVTAFLAIMKWSKMDQLQKVRTCCSLPVIGKCYRLFYGYYVVTNLAMMMRHGLKIREICLIVEKYQSQDFLSLLGKIVKNEVNQGHDLTLVFQQAPFLPPELKLIIEKGSTIDDLGNDLTALANILFQRLASRIERLLTLIQPIIFGIIAIIIVGLYLRLLLPIYHSMQGVI